MIADINCVDAIIIEITEICYDVTAQMNRNCADNKSAITDHVIRDNHVISWEVA